MQPHLDFWDLVDGSTSPEDKIAGNVSGADNIISKLTSPRLREDGIFRVISSLKRRQLEIIRSYALPGLDSSKQLHPVFRYTWNEYADQRV